MTIYIYKIAYNTYFAQHVSVKVSFNYWNNFNILYKINVSNELGHNTNPYIMQVMLNFIVRSPLAETKCKNAANELLSNEFPQVNICSP